MEDHLLADRQAPAAMLRRPADTGPAAFGQLALPGFALLRVHVFVTRTTAKAQGLELTAKVAGQPVGDLLTKALVLFTETDLHGCSPMISVAICCRCQAGAPR
ncbi:hypothetical protein D3C76_1657310 [compost metagenome]